jgi:PST family polysaccharide transporter
MPAPPGGSPSQRLFGQTGNLKLRSVQGGAVALGSQAAKFLIQLGSTVVLARLLTPQDYGAVTMVTALLGFVTLFRDLGLSTATIQRETITHDEVSGLFWINVSSGLALMLIIGACAPLVAWFYGRPDLLWVTLAYAAMAPVASLGAQHQALLQRSLRYFSLAIRDLTALVAGLAVGIAGGWLGLGYWALVLMQATTAVVGVLALWWQSGWRPSRPRWVPGLAHLVKFGGTLTLSNLLGYLMQGLDSVVIGYFFGANGVGLYSRAQALLQKPLEQFMPTVMTVATSAFSRIAPDAARFEENALKLLRMVACTAGILVALVIGTADWVVALLLGARWEGAVPILAALSLFAFVEPSTSLLGALLVARGAPARLVRWRLISAPIVVGGLFAGLRWGPVGMAITYSLSGLLVRAPLFFSYAAPTLGIPRRRIFAAVGPYVVSGLLVAAGLVYLRQLWMPERALTALFTYGALGTMAYVGLVLSHPDGRATVGDLWAGIRLLGQGRFGRSGAGTGPA